MRGGLALEMTASLPPCGGLACKYSCLSDRDAYPAARSMEGGCIRGLVILVVANTLSTQLIITCVPSDFARDNARKVEREQK